MTSQVQKTVTFLNQPMILITQIQRSGGTLLSQLFDGHDQIHAHPHELHIGRPQKWNWPNLDLSQSADEWFGNLYEKRLEQFYGKGYVKPGSNPHAKEDIHPFSFNPKLQLEIFRKAVQVRPPKTQRDILNAYYTSFFAAWEDAPVSPNGRYITAFCPRVLMVPDSVERFLGDYPDGYFVSSVRDPRTWYASSSRHNSAYKDVAKAIDWWKESTRAIVDLKNNQPNRLFLTTYDWLVKETETVMRRVADFVGIDFTESLLMPTYASKPILPNSSYARQSYGVNKQSTTTGSELAEDTLAYIEKEALDLYEEATGLQG